MKMNWVQLYLYLKLNDHILMGEGVITEGVI